MNSVLNRIGMRVFISLTIFTILSLVVGWNLMTSTQMRQEAPSITVAAMPNQFQRVCPGAFVSLGSQEDDATRAASIGDANVGFETAFGTVANQRLTTENGNSANMQLGAIYTLDIDEADVLTPKFAGAQSQHLINEYASGFSATECLQAQADAWHITGSTALGHTSVLVLANPSQVDARVTLEVFSERGAIDAVGGANLLIPSGQQRFYSLASFVPGAAAPVVHVTASGGKVASWIQQSFVKGLETRGMDVAGYANFPAKDQLIPGVTIATIETISAEQTTEILNADFPVLRLFIPGMNESEVTIVATSEDSNVPTLTFARTIPARQVVEVPLENMQNGAYTLSVHAMEPLIAATRTTRIDPTGQDFSWAVAAPSFGPKSAVFVPEGPNPRIHFANALEEPRSVTIQKKNESEGTEVVLGPRQSASLPVAPGFYMLEQAFDIRASVTFNEVGQKSAFPVRPPDSVMDSVVVFPNPYGG